jgi:hypothetical protein
VKVRRASADSLLGEICLVDVYTGVAIAGNELGMSGGQSSKQSPNKLKRGVLTTPVCK